MGSRRRPRGLSELLPRAHRAPLELPKAPQNPPRGPQIPSKSPPEPSNLGLHLKFQKQTAFVPLNNCQIISFEKWTAFPPFQRPSRTVSVGGMRRSQKILPNDQLFWGRQRKERGPWCIQLGAFQTESCRSRLMRSELQMNICQFGRLSRKSRRCSLWTRG